MSLISRSIPGLFGGVSQQIPAMRHPTHCEVQDNGVATLVEGLMKREGLQHVALLPSTGPNSASVQGTNGDVFAHVIERGASGRDLLIIKNGNLMVYELATGAVKTVAFPDGTAYLASASPSNTFKAITVADYTFVVNTSVAADVTATLSPARPVNRGVIFVKQAVAQTTYKVKVGAVTASMTTDTTPTVQEVIAGLKAALITALGGDFTVTEITAPGSPEGPVLSIVKNDGSAITVGCSDSFGDTAMKAIHESVPTFNDLPASLGTLTGFITKVALNPGSDKGAYWVRWDPAANEYKETVAPGLNTSLDPATLPHRLVHEADGTYTLSKITAWTPRDAGDDESNPLPSFVGVPVNDVFFFRNRLGFLAADSVILSKAGKYFSFFADSAQVVLDTDPIDLASTSEQVVELLHAVPFNESLIVWAGGGKQFVLIGGDVLTPKSARLAPSTAFEAYLGCRPEPLGNKCVFATTSGDFTALRALRVSKDTVTNSADDLTEHVPSYVPLDLMQIHASTTAKMVVAVPNGPGSVLYLFKYEEGSNEEWSQKAWQRVTLEDTGTQSSRVIRVHWVDRRLYVVRHIQDTLDASEPGGRFVVELLDFQSRRSDAGASFSLRLDRRLQLPAGTFDGTNTVLEVPYWERGALTVLRCRTGRAPVVLPVLSSTFNAPGTMTLTVPGDQTAEILWVGRPFLLRYRFTEVFMRDQNDTPVQNCRLSLKKVLLRYVNTGFFRVRVRPHMRDEYVYDFSGNVLGSIPLEAPQLATGTFSIPVNSDPQGTTIDIESDSFFPATFPYAEWTGNLVMKAQR